MVGVLSFNFIKLCVIILSIEGLIEQQSQWNKWKPPSLNSCIKYTNKCHKKCSCQKVYRYKLLSCQYKATMKNMLNAWKFNTVVYYHLKINHYFSIYLNSNSCEHARIYLFKTCFFTIALTAILTYLFICLVNIIAVKLLWK